MDFIEGGIVEQKEQHGWVLVMEQDSKFVAVGSEGAFAFLGQRIHVEVQSPKVRTGVGFLGGNESTAALAAYSASGIGKGPMRAFGAILASWASKRSSKNGLRVKTPPVLARKKGWSCNSRVLITPLASSESSSALD